jgi:O-acetyl-ADP-ribose deacetylase (regulator of RNase III)
VRTVKDLGIKSIAIPPLGAGNGGLNWTDVEPLIISAFDGIEGVEVQMFAPAVEPRVIAPEKRRLRMTPGRALIVALMDHYSAARKSLDISFSSGTSHLEIQKLLYFADVIAPLPRITFNQGKYGPYSDTVRLMVQQMEGQFLSGFGDGDDRVLNLRPIEVTEAGLTAVHGYLESAEKASTVINVAERVLNTVDGFEGAYGVELLATTHWVASKENATSVAAATDAVRRWSERKGRIFTPYHVQAALDQLRSVDLIP